MREEAGQSGTHLPIAGGGGVVRILTQVPGELNGVPGRFEYIVVPTGALSHQRFVAGGTINGRPNTP